MNMKPVKSTAITHIGHDGDKMYVTYKGGKTYEFKGVSKDEYNGLMAAKSIGKHLGSMKHIPTGTLVK